MIHDQFLYCRICHEVHRLTPFDRAPIYLLEEMTVREIFTDDRRQFLDRHRGHEIEQLKRVADDRFPIGRPSDPMRVGYVEVTNGHAVFILQVSRSNIADPVTYKVVPRQTCIDQSGEFFLVTLLYPRVLMRMLCLVGCVEDRTRHREQKPRAKFPKWPF